LIARKNPREAFRHAADVDDVLPANAPIWVAQTVTNSLHPRQDIRRKARAVVIELAEKELGLGDLLLLGGPSDRSAK